MENKKHVKLKQVFVSVVFEEFIQNLNLFLTRNLAWKRAERKQLAIDKHINWFDIHKVIPVQ